jgi:hypothetical protein
MTRISSRSIAIWRSKSSRWLCMLMYSPAAIENAPASRPAMPASTIRLLSLTAPATPMTSDRLLTRPSLAPKTAARSVPERPPRCHASSSDPARRAGRLAPPRHRQPLPDRSMLAFVGGDGGGLGRQLVGICLLLVALECLDQVGHPAGPEQPGEHDDQSNAQSWAADRRHGLAGPLEAAGPDVGVASLVGGDARERSRPYGIGLDARQFVVERHGVALEAQVGQALAHLLGGELERAVGHRGQA